MDLKQHKKTKTKKRKEPVQRKLSSLLALDFSGSGVKAVRLKKAKGQIALFAVDILPPLNPDEGKKPVLSKALSAYYTSICINPAEARVRVFSRIMAENENVGQIVRETLGVSEEFRTASRVLIAGSARNESSILGVAIPENALKQHLDLFAEGAPAPHSLELSGLAAFSAFMFNRGKQTAGQSICLIEAGRRHTYVAFFHKNQLQVLNRFDVGGEVLQKQVESTLGVDPDMAQTILADGSVDVSAPVRSALASFVKQLSIYREYVERQNKSPLSGVYLSGDEAVSPHWQSAIQEVLSLAPVVWSPFDKLDVPEGAYPENLKGQESRFAAAVGAALGGMEAI